MQTIGGYSILAIPTQPLKHSFVPRSHYSIIRSGGLRPPQQAMISIKNGFDMVLRRPETSATDVFHAAMIN